MLIRRGRRGFRGTTARSAVVAERARLRGMHGIGIASDEGLTAAKRSC